MRISIRYSLIAGLFVLGCIATSPGEFLHPIEDPAAPDAGVCWQNCAPANPEPVAPELPDNFA